MPKFEWPLFLLGAGTSVDAGLPLASEMTRRMLDDLNPAARFETINSDYVNSSLLNYVVAVMVADAGRRHGHEPTRLPDIEAVVSAVELLGERADVELAPFVQTWDPGIETHAANRRETRDQDVEKLVASALESRFPGSAFDKLVDARIGSKDSGESFQRLLDRMFRHVVKVLETEESPEYLLPLIETGREQHLTIATLNYDTLVENTAHSNSVPVSRCIDSWPTTSRLTIPEEGFTGIELLKLHGSIDWSSQPPKSDSQLQTFASERFNTSPGHTPAIVYGRRGKLRSQGPFLALRSRFEDQLFDAQALVCVGYSFGDEHVNAVIRRWLATDEDRWITILDPADPPSRNYWGPPKSFRDELAHLLMSGRKHTSAAQRLFHVPQTASQGLPLVCCSAGELHARMQQEFAQNFQ